MDCTKTKIQVSRQTSDLSSPQQHQDIDSIKTTKTMKQNYSALLKVLYYSTYLKVLYCRYIVGNRDKKHGKRMLDKVIKTEN